MAETSNLRSWIICVIGILSILNFVAIYAGNAIVTEGGYRNVTVAIGERVPEDTTLLDRIRDDFTEASEFLFQATNNHLYFSEITILVPRSWTSYTAPDKILSERFETSDFIIDVSQENRPNRPFTNKDSGCGQPGRYIHFTPTFIADSNEANKYGGYGKTIAHEWAHYRWGVFDEYSRPGAPSFYAASNGRFEGTRCTLAVSGRAVATEPGKSDADCDPQYGEPPDHCRFVDDLTTTSRYRASLLYKQFLPKISDFCDSGPTSQTLHNREAPNLQNIHCFGKSIWQVMNEHNDLKTGAIAATTNTLPTFKIVQPTANNWVLVLDASGSMKGERLRQMRQAASNFINTALQLHESLAIITFFNGTTRTNADLTEIKSQNERNRLIDSLPTSAGGVSNIGQGIQAGRAQFFNRGIFGGRMLVITDGEETTAPFIENIIHLLEATLTTVDTIAIGPDSAENLELLTRRTGGQSFYHSGSSSTLDEVFKAFSERNRDTSDALITVFAKTIQLLPSQSDSSNMVIDASIGEDTQFLFDYSEGEDSIEGTLTRPDGSTITSADTNAYVVDRDFSRTRITIDGTASAGDWQLNLMNTSPTKQNVTIIVQSRARKDNSGNQVDPIRATATWGKESVNILSNSVESNNQTLFVTVSKGYVPVLDADVKATVSAPGGDIQPFNVYDDGLGADIQKYDGIYSAFLTEFKGQGRYGLSVSVENSANKAVLSPATVLGQGSVINPNNEQVLPDKPAGLFQRVNNGGSFTCEGSLCTGITDVFPPARILDLKATVLDLTKPDVTLTYSAPGDNLMTGSVFRYEIRSSKAKINILYDDFQSAELVTSLRGTTMARSKESFTVTGLEIGYHSYFFAIVAVDDSDHRSLVSNIASASMRFVSLPPGVTLPPEPPTTTTEFVPTTKFDGGITNSLSTFNTTTTKSDTPFTPLLIAIVVAAPLIAILLALLILACCLFCGCCGDRRRRREEDNEKNAEAQLNGDIGEMPIYGNINDPNLEDAPAETTMDHSRVAVMVFPNGDAAHMSAAAESSRTPTRTARIVSHDRTGDSADITATAESSGTPTRTARIVSRDRTGDSADITATAEAGSRTPTLTARVVSRTENDYDSAAMSAPISGVENTRRAVVVTQKETPEVPPLLKSKPEVRQNVYGELPDKKYYANGHGPGPSRRPPNYRYDSSSDDEDEIAREKRRIKQQEPEYY